MMIRNWLLFIGIFWTQNLHEALCAPATPFQASQPLLSPLDSSDKAAISHLKREAALEKQGSAAGSADFFHQIKKSLGNTIKSKIGQLAKSSAGASAYFSHSSSGPHGQEHGYGSGIGHGHGPVHVPYSHYNPHYYAHDDDDHQHLHKPFDFWSLKKSVLYTLLQAVKAIKGGVIAIKGQLIKGGGHLLTAKGKLIRGGGEALTTIGKNIAASAFMFVPDPHDVEHGHSVGPDVHHAEHYEHGGYSAVSGPASLHAVAGVSGPSGPSPHYGVPSGLGTGPPSGGGGYYYHNSVIPDGRRQPEQPDGLIILRKIPRAATSDNDVDHEHAGSNAYDHNHHPHDVQDEQESQKTPSFKPLSDATVPKIKTLNAEPEKTPAVPRSKVTLSQQQATQLESLMGYLEYIREQRNKGQGTNTQPTQSAKMPKVQNLMFVTPYPIEAMVKLPVDPVNPHEALQAQTASLHEHLKELHELQQLQHLQTQEHLGQLFGGSNIESPTYIELPIKVDTSNILHQDQTFSISQLPHLPHLQRGPHFPEMQGQDDSSTNPFVIHYPDFESGQEARAATRKRHVGSHLKPKRLQQIRHMQRQLLREVPKSNAPPRSRIKSPTVDMVRSIEFSH